MDKHLLIYISVLIDILLLILMQKQQTRNAVQNITELHRENSDPNKSANQALSSLKIKKKLFRVIKLILLLRLLLLLLILHYNNVNIVTKIFDVVGSVSWLYVYKLIFNFVVRLNADTKANFLTEKRLYIIILTVLILGVSLMYYYVRHNGDTWYNAFNIFTSLTFSLTSLLLLLNSMKLLSSLVFYTKHTQKLKKKVA